MSVYVSLELGPEIVGRKGRDVETFSYGEFISMPRKDSLFETQRQRLRNKICTPF